MFCKTSGTEPIGSRFHRSDRSLAAERIPFTEFPITQAMVVSLMRQSHCPFTFGRWACYFALLLCLACSAGCPDYSHLRPAPDYSNMTDSGGDAKEAESSEP